MKNIIILILLVFGVYTGYVFGAPYARYLLFHRDVSNVVINYYVYKNEGEILERVMESAVERSIPVQQEDVDIDMKFDARMRVVSVGIKLHYVVRVRFLGSEKTLNYDIDVFHKSTTSWAL